MKKTFLNFSRLGIFFVLAFAAFSCTDDGTVGGGTTPGGPALEPFIRFLSESGAITSDATLSPGETIRVKLDLQTGDNQLKALTITEDGSSVAATRMSFNSGLTTVQNPLLITGSDKNGVEILVDIDPHDAGTKTYRFEVEDEGGLKDAVSVDVTINTGPLSIALVDEAPYIASDFQVDQATTFSVKVNVSRGPSPIASFSVAQDDELITDLTRLEVNDEQFASNPFGVGESGENGFEAIIDVRSHEGGTAKYTFIVTDADGTSETTSINVTIGENIDGTFETILLNNADGQNEGGLDLDGGDPKTVRHTSADAEIRDLGIDLDLPASSNWIQKVEPRNGATMVYLGRNGEGDLNFANITAKQAIKDLHTGGSTAAVSPKLEQGDVFTVQKNNDYFLILVTDVVRTPTDNNDYYELTVKQAFDVQ